MSLLRLFPQEDGSIRRSKGRRRPLVEDLEGRQLLSGIIGSHIGSAVADIQGAHIGSAVADIVGSHIGSATADIVGSHIGSATADIVGSHIGTSLAVMRKH